MSQKEIKITKPTSKVIALFKDARTDQLKVDSHIKWLLMAIVDDSLRSFMGKLFENAVKNGEKSIKLNDLSYGEGMWKPFVDTFLNQSETQDFVNKYLNEPYPVEDYKKQLCNPYINNIHRQIKIDNDSNVKMDKSVDVLLNNYIKFIPVFMVETLEKNNTFKKIKSIQMENVLIVIIGLYNGTYKKYCGDMIKYLTAVQQENKNTKKVSEKNNSDCMVVGIKSKKSENEDSGDIVVDVKSIKKNKVSDKKTKEKIEKLSDKKRPKTPKNK
jgi:hypothetical protein